jgi:hypothetical protein
MQEPDMIRYAALVRMCCSTLSHNYRGRFHGLALQQHYTNFKHQEGDVVLTRNSLHNMLWRTCTSPLLSLQGRLLLRPQLPKIGLEDPPQRLRTHHADLLRACHT